MALAFRVIARGKARSDWLACSQSESSCPIEDGEDFVRFGDNFRIFREAVEFVGQEKPVVSTGV